jgi:hypothetical protein
MSNDMTDLNDPETDETVADGGVNLPVVSFDMKKDSSENMEIFFGELAAAQSEFVPIVQDKINPFFSNEDRKSRYASLQSIIRSTRPALCRHGFCVIQLPVATKDRHLSIKTIMGHSSGQYLSFEFEIPLDKATVHGHGSAITYCRRYSYTSLCCVAPDEDDDGNAAVGLPAAPHVAAEFLGNKVYVGALKAVNDNSLKSGETRDQYVKRIGSLLDERSRDGALNEKETIALREILKTRFSTNGVRSVEAESAGINESGDSQSETEDSDGEITPTGTPPQAGDSVNVAGNPESKTESSYRKIRKQMKEDTTSADLQSTMDATSEMIREGDYVLSPQEVQRLEVFFAKCMSDLKTATNSP